MKKYVVLSALCMSSAMMAPVAVAQSYPDKLVKVVVPFSPGGGNDFLARDISQAMQARYKQSFVVENRPGAGGAIGSAQVARSPADGYTLLMAANTAAIVDATRDDLTFSLTKDFRAVGMVADMPIMAVVNPALGVKNVQELIALAKKKPGQLNYASSGPGTVQHMAAALFNSMTDTQMEHVPFKGASQMVPEVLANRIQVLFGPANTVMPFVRAGDLVALGVASEQRWPEMPELPTVAEQGVKGYKVDLWYALLAPAGTPDDVVKTLSDTLVGYLDEPTTRERYKGQALTPSKTTPAQMDQRIADDVALWKDVAQRINFRAGN